MTERQPASEVEARLSFAVVGAIVGYLISRITASLSDSESIPLTCVMFGLGILIWVLMWLLLKDVAPIAMTVAATCYILGRLIRLGESATAWNRLQDFQESPALWHFSQLVGVVGLLCFAYVLWVSRAGHRLLAVLIFAFAILLLTRAYMAEHAGIVFYSLVTFLRNLIGGGSYIALGITFFLHGLRCRAEHRGSVDGGEASISAA